MKIINNIKDFLSSAVVIKTTAILGFSLIMTTIISSQNFFFQDIIENGISKKDIYAQKTLVVEDVVRTAQRKKELTQKIDPVLTKTGDDFIRSNLETLENSILQIRKKDVQESEKKEEISLLFDISNPTTKDFVVNFFLKSEEPTLKEVFEKANTTLASTLNTGISEKDFENNRVDKIIAANLVSNVSKRQITIIEALLSQIIVPNLIVDEDATEMARKNAENSVKPYEVTFQKGEKIVFEGEGLTTRLKLDALRQAGYNVYELNWQGLTGIFALVLLATFIYIFYMRFFAKKFVEPKYYGVGAFLAILLASSAVLIPTGFSPYVLPIPAFVFLLSIFTSPRVAFVAITVLLSVLSIGMQYQIQFVVAFLLLSLVSIVTVSQIRYSRRFDLLKAGLIVSVVGVLVVLSIYILEKCLIDVNNTLILRDCAYIFANGIISSMIVFGVIPLFENMFGIITPYGLAELSDHNQDLLKTLLRCAPGTYHHSLMVANLCEAAAEAIGADPILARVGAYYHDIGKLKRPLFFIENQSYFVNDNPHNNYTPRVSKMLITAHPNDGIEYAKKYKLPPIIHNFILQHHGEGLVSYFYNEAVKEEGAENVQKDQFRYPGPKPNMKETAILMLADAIESAVRAAKNPTPEDIEKIIDKIITERLNDGQLSDSPLTLRDIQVIATTFSRILRGMQHERIKYQEVDEQLTKNKLNVTNKLLDADLENKILELENHAKNISVKPNSVDKTNNDLKNEDNKNA